MTNFETNVIGVTAYFRNVMPVSYTRNELKKTMRNDKYFGKVDSVLFNRVMENLALYAR